MKKRKKIEVLLGLVAMREINLFLISFFNYFILINDVLDFAFYLKLKITHVASLEVRWRDTWVWLSQNWGFAKGGKHEGSLLPFFLKGGQNRYFCKLKGWKVHLSLKFSPYHYRYGYHLYSPHLKQHYAILPFVNINNLIGH